MISIVFQKEHGRFSTEFLARLPNESMLILGPPSHQVGAHFFIFFVWISRLGYLSLWLLCVCVMNVWVNVCLARLSPLSIFCSRSETVICLVLPECLSQHFMSFVAHLFYVASIPNAILMRHMLLVIDSLTHSSQFLSFLSTATRYILTLTYNKLLILISLVCGIEPACVCVARFLRIIYFGKRLVVVIKGTCPPMLVISFSLSTPSTGYLWERAHAVIQHNILPCWDGLFLSFRLSLPLFQKREREYPECLTVWDVFFGDVPRLFE